MSRLSFLVCNSTLHSKGLFNQNLVGFSQRDLCHPHQKDLKIFYQVDSHLEDCSNCGSSSNEAAIQQCSILTNQSHSYWQMDDEPFNPDYVEVDRVLDVSESTDENGEVWLLSLTHPLQSFSKHRSLTTWITFDLKLLVDILQLWRCQSDRPQKM